MRNYCKPTGRGGPPRGVMLPAYVELLQATGDRPGEVLAIQWPEIDLLGDPPTATVSGTLIDHGKIPGKPLHRQDSLKGDAPRTLFYCPSSASRCSPNCGVSPAASPARC